MRNEVIKSVYFVAILFITSSLNATNKIYCPEGDALKQINSSQGPWMTTFGETLGPVGTQIIVSNEDINPQVPWKLLRAQLTTAGFTQILDCIYEGTAIYTKRCNYVRSKRVFSEKFSLTALIDRNDCAIPEDKMAKFIICP